MTALQEKQISINFELANGLTKNHQFEITYKKKADSNFNFSQVLI